jgi:hypothetical protein
MESVIDEVSRANGDELNNTSSVVRGMVTQDAIKLITRQHVQVGNNEICVYDGIRETTAVLMFQESILHEFQIISCWWRAYICPVAGCRHVNINQHFDSGKPGT